MPRQSLLYDIPLEVTVVIGRTKMKLKDIANIGYGSIIDFDTLENEEVEILVNGKKVAYGEIVVIDNNYGVRITSIIDEEERLRGIM